MLSALIQTAREAEPPADDPPSTSRAKQLRLNSAFRVMEKPPPQQRKAPSATLIVAPTSLLSQWAEELQRSSKPDTLKVLVWHGTNRLDLDTAVDGDGVTNVVITSYGTLVSEHAKHERQPSSVFEGMNVHNIRKELEADSANVQSNGCVSGTSGIPVRLLICFRRRLGRGAPLQVSYKQNC